jgi:hypothetical protein
MMKGLRRGLMLLALVFGFVAVSFVHEPVAMANLVDDANKGHAEAEKFALGMVGIAVVLGIALTVACLIFPPTRRFGIAIGSGLVILLVAVILTKSTSIGTTLGEVVGADSVTDIFTNK